MTLSGFIPGAIGGISLTLVGHPFDLIKVRLQTTPNSTLYTCLLGTFKNSGPRGFYQGVTAPLIGVIPIFALYYGSYKWTKKTLNDTSSFGDNIDTALAAMTAATITSSISCPAERIKILLQIAPSYQNTGFRGINLLVKMMYSNNGIRAFYRGLSIMLIREIPSSIIYFSVYESIRNSFIQDTTNTTKSTITTGPIILAGGLAGMSSWLSTAPLDILKSIRQSEIKHSSLPIWAIAKSIWEKEGFRGFYKGALPALARAFPANAACFGGIEMAHLLFDNDDVDQVTLNS